MDRGVKRQMVTPHLDKGFTAAPEITPNFLKRVSFSSADNCVNAAKEALMLALDYF
jgi:hypothetical protein